MAAGSMFSISLSDRLKAAVNNLDAAGNALQAQARAIGQPVKDGSPRPPSPNATLKTTSAASSPLIGPNVEKNHTQPDSPTRTTSGHYVASTSALAENALSGLRKSFNFGGRPSIDGHRPSASIIQPSQQELKNIPSTPGPTEASGSRPSSPARNLNLNQPHFQLGSDPSSIAATPQSPRSPGPTHSNLVPRSPRSPARQPLPPPDPSDPATYPLPPSPTLSSTSPLLSTSTVYADPLGVSPLLDPHESFEPPSLGPQEPSPIEEEGRELVGLGVEGVAVGQSEPDIPTVDAVIKGDVEDTQNGKPPEMDAEVEQKLAAAERRYEGTLHISRDALLTDHHIDLSQRFTTLLKQTHDADRILKEFTPLEGGIQDHEALEGWVRMMKAKVEMITEEMKRLQDKIRCQFFYTPSPLPS